MLRGQGSGRGSGEGSKLKRGRRDGEQAGTWRRPWVATGGPNSGWEVPETLGRRGGHSGDWRDSCFSQRLMTWCTNWVLLARLIIPPLPDR